MNDERLVPLERQVRTLQVSLVAAWCTVGLRVLAAFRSQDSPRILRVRGLIVEDSTASPSARMSPTPTSDSESDAAPESSSTTPSASSDPGTGS